MDGETGVTVDTAACVDEVLDRLGGIRVPGAQNVYDEDDCVGWGDGPGLATQRRLALRDHLVSRWAAPAVLVGEAPGRDGARWSGVPFTSCRQLRGSGPTEPTATVVHRVLSELGCAGDVLFWNASMLFAPGNRDPRRSEVAACAQVLALVRRGRAVFAVGRFAQMATDAPYIRHPSHGGVPRFAEGLRVALRSPPGTDLRAALGRLDTAARSAGLTGADLCRVAAGRTLHSMLYYGHGSWVVLVVFAGMFVLRMVSTQRRRGRGGGRGTWGPGRSFTGEGPAGPPGDPTHGPRIPEGTTAAGTAPGWFADPFFKHEQRYWSGTEWTEHVTDNGSPGTDPPPPDPGPRRPG